jgi:uncharacterized protein YutD
MIAEVIVVFCIYYCGYFMGKVVQHDHDILTVKKVVQDMKDEEAKGK